MALNWTEELLGQLEWHWQNQLRPRLDGLTDDEYFWEPVPECWSIRRRGESTAPIAVGRGDWLMEYAYPEPTPAPLTTIAWQLAHIIVAVFGQRNASHFGAPPAGYRTFDYAGSADGALEQLDDAYATWVKGVRSLDAHGLARPCGPAEEPFDESPMGGLVLHIHREVIHHGSVVSLLRDLYIRKDDLGAA